MLAYPDTRKPYIPYTDINEKYMDACLCLMCEEANGMQLGLPDENLLVLSRKLTASQMN